MTPFLLSPSSQSRPPLPPRLASIHRRFLCLSPSQPNPKLAERAPQSPTAHNHSPDLQQFRPHRTRALSTRIAKRTSVLDRSTGGRSPRRHRARGGEARRGGPGSRPPTGPSPAQCANCQSSSSATHFPRPRSRSRCENVRRAGERCCLQIPPQDGDGQRQAPVRLAPTSIDCSLSVVDDPSYY